MRSVKTKGCETVLDLPPLILHPFNERVSPASLLENSKAALILAGLAPGGDENREELQRRVLAGRYAEIRMLFYVGRDVLRWIEQCLEIAGRNPAPEFTGIRGQSFAALLTETSPANVKEKLTQWGVTDHAAIFARGIALNALFADPPAFATLGEQFLRHYHRYADAAFQCYMESEEFRPVSADEARFELYASGEYSRMLEAEWEAQ